MQLLVVFILGCLVRVPAAELHVPTLYLTISNAVIAARAGDTIRIAPGDYYEQFVIISRTNLTLQGEPGTVLNGA